MTTTQGTVTFAFTDIEGSTRLLHEFGDGYVELLGEHNRIVRHAFTAHGGEEAGNEGDALFFVVPSARAALIAAVEAQRDLAAHPWPNGGEVRVRMGLHTGEMISKDHGLVGIDLHRAARISAAAHGGQIVISEATYALVAHDLPEDLSLIDLGQHELKDLAKPQRLYQVAGTGLRRDFPAIRSQTRASHNLPQVASSFVGRHRELAEASDIVRTSRLVTITGPGGVGKTRLAVETASACLDTYPDGVWMVELASVSDPERVPGAIASLMRLVEQPGRDLLDTIADYLRGHRTLVFLDNCEHLLDVCALTAHALLEACPQISVLATSQEPFGLPEESVMPLTPMTVPPGVDDPDEALSYDAVKLFRERARQADPSFEIDRDNVAAVVDICSRLDGIPLAIELAASRVSALSPKQIASRLEDRFRLLTGGTRIAMPRHRTLRAALDWSHELLPEPERVLFGRLSVFAGSFGLDAAEAVAADDEIDKIDVLDLLAGLVAKSLLTGEVSAGERRYRMLGTVRQYAAERLDERGDAEEVRRRHRDWYLNLVEEARPAFVHGMEPVEWLDRFDVEHDNLQAALRWSTETPGEAQRGLRLAEGLWRFWEIRGYLVEGRTTLERLIEITKGDPALRANALTGAGILADLQGDYEASIAFHEASLVLRRQLGNQSAVAYSLNNLANAAVKAGHLERAHDLYAESVELCRSQGDDRALGFALVNLAGTVSDPGEAERLFEDSVAIMRAEGDRWGLAHVLDQFALITMEGGAYDTARQRFRQAGAIYEALGDDRGVTRILVHLGDLERRVGDGDEARRLYETSLEMRARIGDRAGLAASMERLARVTASPEQAAALLGAAGHIRATMRAPLAPSEVEEQRQLLAELGTDLGADGLDDALAAGRALSLDQVLGMMGAAG